MVTPPHDLGPTDVTKRPRDIEAKLADQEAEWAARKSKTDRRLLGEKQALLKELPGAMTVEEYAAKHGVGRTTVWYRIRNGSLRSITVTFKVGKVTRRRTVVLPVE
jgi:hypothetical protein